MAFDIMDSMRMIVTQTLVPRKGGGKVAAREYMVFNPATRAAFLSRSPEQWPQLARAMMDHQTAKSQKLVRAARTLLEKELITIETYERMITREI
jgi:defect in organelle trafficking protein DotB